MAKLKDRREAHRLVAGVLQSYLKASLLYSADAAVRAEVQKICEAHFIAGTIMDGVPDDFEVPEIGSLAMGGENRCHGCGKELNDKSKRLCAECEAKAEPEPESKNGKALA